MLVTNILTIFSVGLMTRVATQQPNQQHSFGVSPGSSFFYNNGVQNLNPQSQSSRINETLGSFIPPQLQLTGSHLSQANQHKKKFYQKGRLIRKHRDQRGRQGSNCLGVCTYIPDRDLCPTYLARETEPDDYDDDYDYSDESSGRRRRRRSIKGSNKNRTSPVRNTDLGFESSSSQAPSLHLVFPPLTMFAVSKGAIQSSNVTKKEKRKQTRAKPTRGKRPRPASSAARLRPPALEQEIIIRWDRVVERGPFIGGDIVVPDGVLLRPPNLRFTSRWPKGRVPYTIDQTLNDCRLDTIYDAMDEIEDLTCIRFVERNRERDYLSIRRAELGCASYVGMIGGTQQLNLSTGCFSKFTVTHELIHAIGMDHEQSRRDRSKFIEVDYDNVKRGKRSQFEVNPSHGGSGFPYDIRSIMHYSAFLFARDNCEPTIYPVDSDLDVCDLGIGNGKGGMTKCDAAKINKLYKCGRRYPKRCRVSF
ncbi:Zinc metalloproteinase nas-14 [Orchesella cincta]|uniref:Metalloendopeptidase n=1 Tax=Orchesella cincta TaxID=48709 RepID=A0A1D2N2W1_ORCCI|nr:Zinc metalloproteinase nas-14 [Orchesella cincta]